MHQLAVDSSSNKLWIPKQQWTNKTTTSQPNDKFKGPKGFEIMKNFREFSKVGGDNNPIVVRPFRDRKDITCFKCQCKGHIVPEYTFVRQLTMDRNVMFLALTKSEAYVPIDDPKYMRTKIWNLRKMKS